MSDSSPQSKSPLIPPHNKSDDRVAINEGGSSAADITMNGLDSVVLAVIGDCNADATSDAGDMATSTDGAADGVDGGASGGTPKQPLLQVTVEGGKGSGGRRKESPSYRGMWKLAYKDFLPSRKVSPGHKQKFR